MKCLLLSLFFGFQIFLSAQAADPMPIAKMAGVYRYQGQFDIPTIRRLELIPSQTDQGKKRIKELRKEGYNCYNKNLKVMRCSKKLQNQPAPDWVSGALDKFLLGLDIQFYPRAEVEPELVHDGFTTQMWSVKEKVRVDAATVNFYNVRRSHEGKISIAFPVSENQPIGNLRYHSHDKLGLQLISNVKESELVTYTYVLEPFFQPLP